MSLTLIPTPLHPDLPLEPVALAFLHDFIQDSENLILVEEHKVARGRWLKWGLPRECIERFIAFNEHSAAGEEKKIIDTLKSGKRAVLMSDGGLPAFCDPGQALVNRCHQNGIKVTSTPFPHSVTLALALSGFSHQSFFFQGFLPQKDPERREAISRLWKTRETQILMDTPYRLTRLIDELFESADPQALKRRWFLALELNSPGEELIQGKPSELKARAASLGKQEFILIIESV